MFANYRFYRAVWLITLWACSWTLPVQAAAAEITPNEVFAQALQIEKEVDLLKRHYNITAVNPVVSVEADLQPRHVWQKCYVILLKLSIFRRKHGLPGFAPLALEPSLKLDPNLNWSQTQRILNEFMIVKKLLNIPGTVSPATTVQDKRPIDVFNKLDQISYAVDTLNGEPVSLSYVYAEVLRFNEDVDSILRKLGITDSAFPPTRNPEAQPKDSLNAAFALLDELQLLQRQLGLDTTDFSVFHKTDNVVPSDALKMVTLGLAELQVIKAKLGMVHSITPAAEVHEGKTPVEVTQLLGFVTNKLHLVKVQ